MNCLCCGKPLPAPDESGWHKSCIKRFFGTTKLPEIEIDDKTFIASSEIVISILSSFSKHFIALKIAFFMSSEETGLNSKT